VVLSAGLLEYLIPNNTKKEAKNICSGLNRISNQRMNYKKACRPLIRAKQAFPMILK
jgi:hypothetical protein